MEQMTRKDGRRYDPDNDILDVDVNPFWPLEKWREHLKWLETLETSSHIRDLIEDAKMAIAEKEEKERKKKEQEEAGKT
jgi:hypothetical protein